MVQRDSSAAAFSIFTVNSGTDTISGVTISGGNATSGGGINGYDGSLDGD